MQIQSIKGDLLTQKCDLLVINEFEGDKTPTGVTGAVNIALNELLIEIAKEMDFTGKIGSSFMFRTNCIISAKRVLVVGLGKKEDFNIEVIREVAAVSCEQAKSVQAKHVVSILHGAGYGGINARESAKAITEGLRLGAYEFTKYKSQKNKIQKSGITTFEIVEKDFRKANMAKQGIELGEIFAKATITARDLVNEPAQHMSPRELLNVSELIAKEKGGCVKIKVYGKDELTKLGAGAFLGVAQGSDHEPYLVHMTYKPTKAKKKVAIVGKAITFDSGGLSLKPANAMETMKIDMAGAASVIGVFSALKELKPNVEVHGIFAACENMPSGKAIRPGDIVRAMNKKTIEIKNTDAEGRVTLADSLSYAVRQKPDMIIDVATLTGACMVALGEEIAGVMSNNAKLANKILVASARAGEKMWELPLEKRYKKLIKSEVADIKNVGGQYGGALTAGLFLEEFVDNIPWAHIDIAGPSYAEKPLNSYAKHGGTGYCVRTLLDFLMNV